MIYWAQVNQLNPIHLTHHTPIDSCFIWLSVMLPYPEWLARTLRGKGRCRDGYCGEAVFIQSEFHLEITWGDSFASNGIHSRGN